jgi:transposase InsO family protein
MAGRVTAMDIKLLVATLPEDTKLAPWCRKLGISRQTAYKWRARYRAEGVAGLEERSRAPKRPAGRVDASVEDAVVAVRKQLAEEGLDIGPASIHDRLVAQGRAAPSEATIWRIAVRRGQVNPQPAKRPKVSYRRFERSRPNECWQGDDTHYPLASGQEVRIINLIDDHSRLNVDSLAVAVCTSARVWEAFARAVSRHGLPAEFLDDNGRAYVSPRGEQPVLFQAHLDRLGVRQIRSRAYHPQTCGKVERFHQTQRRWLTARPPAATLAELQALLDDFRQVYNHSRPHRALGRRTPGTVWAAQPAAAPAHRADEPPVLIGASLVGPSGTISTSGHFVIGLGTEWAYRHVTVVRRGLTVTVIDTNTGEIVRELTIDPNRRYQSTGRPRGGPARGRKV